MPPAWQFLPAGSLRVAITVLDELSALLPAGSSGATISAPLSRSGPQPKTAAHSAPTVTSLDSIRMAVPFSDWIWV
jgi:hypothetical protein